jgi:hypothetical protein
VIRYLALGGLALAGALTMACFVDRKSDTLACSTAADCSDNRVCQDGYCVRQSQSDCPAHCDACNTSVTPHTCIVTSTGGSNFTCPDGFQCLINCSGGNACGDLTCAGGAQCVIACSGANSCGDITCSAACACDVTCTGGGCAAIACPHQGANYCTSDQQDGSPCSSMVSGRCNSC